MMKKTVLGYLFSQVHQPFFALGIFNAILFMILFTIPKSVSAEFPLSLFHAYAMIFAVFGNFFYGFLLTTFTRFSARPPIAPRVYLNIFSLNLLSSLSLLAYPLLHESFYAASIFEALSLVYLMRTFHSIYLLAPEPKNDQYWILVSLGMASLSNLLFLLYEIPCGSCSKIVFYRYGVDIGIYLFLTLLSAVVAFRMVPFFSGSMLYERSRYFHPLLFTLLLLHVLLDSLYPGALFLCDFAISLLLVVELMRMELPIPSKEPLLWSLHLALFWLPLAFFVGAIVEFFEAWFSYHSFRLPLHMLLLGYLTTLLIAFGTRVTLGHGGAVLRVDGFGRFIFYFTQFVLLARVLYSLTEASSPLLYIAAVAWIALFVLWSVKYGSILLMGAGKRGGER